MSASIPRLGYNELPVELQELLQAKYERLGYLGEFFQVMSHQPLPMQHFYRFTESIKDVLPVNLAELVSIRISNRFGNVYEQHQHERLAVKLGQTKQWVADVLTAPGKENELSKAEKKVKQLADDILTPAGRDSFAAVAEELGHELAVAVLWLVARTAAHASVSTALGLASPVTSPLDEVIDS